MTGHLTTFDHWCLDSKCRGEILEIKGHRKKIRDIAIELDNGHTKLFESEETARDWARRVKVTLV